MAVRAFPHANPMHETTRGKRASMKGLAVILPLRAGFVQECIADFATFVQRVPEAAASSFNCIAVLNDTVVLTHSERGCFANRGHHLMSVVEPTWENPEHDHVCRQWAHDAASLFKRELERQGHATADSDAGAFGVKGPKGALMMYGNYDQYGEKTKDLFGDHYERLQDIKARYDPTNTFNKLLPIPPKLAG